MIKLIALFALLLVAPASAQMVMHIPAEVVRVVDGDTLEVRAYLWPGHTWLGKVRLRGIDTPELRGKCEIEKVMALDAKQFVETMIGHTVILENVNKGKYAGRVVATVLVGDDNLRDLLLLNGHGRAYDGGKRQGWCG